MGSTEEGGRKRREKVAHGNRFRQSNEVTVRDSYHLPIITDIIESLATAAFITTLDIRTGFVQVETHPDDISKTAFARPYGHYEYVRMGMRLRNSSSTFHSVM